MQNLAPFFDEAVRLCLNLCGNQPARSIADTERIARRVLGGAHPLTEELEDGLRDARAALSTRESS